MVTSIGNTTIGGASPSAFSNNALLEEITKLNKALLQYAPVFRIGEEQGWKFEEAGKSLVFKRRVTLTTTDPISYTLSIPYPFILSRIEEAFSTSNAKNISIEQYSSDYTSSYITLLSSAADTGTSIQHIADPGYRCSSFTKLACTFGTFTNGEVVDIAIYLEKLI